MIAATHALTANQGQPTDRKLAREVSHQLAETNRPNLKRIAVDVQAGQVTLSGRVASFYEKQIAIQTCRMLAGVERLIDAVDVAAAY
jgi:osmotically-inducible protein OsmY